MSTIHPGAGQVPEPTIPIACSFCGKTQREVMALIQGPAVQICDECIMLSLQILISDGRDARKRKAPAVVPEPTEPKR
jgi:ATP-dependent Clp protease ATP-binding subunit ClpX